MPKCTKGVVDFGRVGRRVVQAAFDRGGIVSDGIVSDGGVMLLRQIDERIGLPGAAEGVFTDGRRAATRNTGGRLLADRSYEVRAHRDLLAQQRLGYGIERRAKPGQGARQRGWIPNRAINKTRSACRAYVCRVGLWPRGALNQRVCRPSQFFQLIFRAHAS